MSINPTKRLFLQSIVAGLAVAAAPKLYIPPQKENEDQEPDR